jgi:hypothetical protein
MTTCECGLLHATRMTTAECLECGMGCCRSCGLEIDGETYCRWCAVALQPVVA